MRICNRHRVSQTGRSPDNAFTGITDWERAQSLANSLRIQKLHRKLDEFANRRYLEFLSALEDPRNGRRKLDKLSQPVEHQGRSYPGFNFFDQDDDALFRAIARGEFNLSGMQNKTLRRWLRHKTSSQVSPLLKRLRLHGLINKIGRTYKYCLTQFRKQVLTTGLKLRELVVIPQLITAGYLA